MCVSESVRERGGVCKTYAFIQNKAKVKQNKKIKLVQLI